MPHPIPANAAILNRTVIQAAVVTARRLFMPTKPSKPALIIQNAAGTGTGEPLTVAMSKRQVPAVA